MKLKCIQLVIVPMVALTPRLEADEPLAAIRLPTNVPPVIAVWDWRESADGPDGYKTHLEMMARHSGVNILVTPFGAPGKQVTDAVVREQVRSMAQYASRFGIRLVMGLDIRHAREAFGQAHPDELQEMLRLREVALKASGEVTFTITSKKLVDRYTRRTGGYVNQAGKLVRIYAYERGTNGIKAGTVRDITEKCASKESQDAVSVTIPCDLQTEGMTACVMVSFTYLVADVFAPHLLSFQRNIVESYRDLPLIGARKDEWGFPASVDGKPVPEDYWYSRFLAKAYSEQTGGRDLVRDCLLMTCGEVGREIERQVAINHFREVIRLRNGIIEQDFYDAVKSAWGREAFVGTHPTWWPYPDGREFKKNSLHWWITPRDFAQTDENTPYCVRTALTKKWGSPVWYNMYYSPKVSDYQAELWADALTGGRIDYHGLWPVDLKVTPNEERYRALLRGGLMRGDCRVRLLNFITRSALDCPAAVVFGQPCAMNWAGPAYDDVGLKLTDALWQAGYPADLIPTPEIWTGSLTISADGYIQYGPQRYQSVVLYHPELDKATTAEFFGKAARGKTTLYRVGGWTRDFEGLPFGVSTSLPQQMEVLANSNVAVERITRQFTEAGIAPQARADRTVSFGNCHSVAPPAEGESRLLDGTHIFVSGTKTASGDLIQRTVQVRGRAVTVDAIGLVALRLDKRGRVEALAAGGLKSLSTDGLNIELPERVDLALWRDGHGRFHGVLQGWSGPVPAPLQKLTKDWLRLSVPVPLQ